jgi:hypothetical protein
LISLDDAATEVFQILRSYDYAVMMYDDDGDQVYEPESARRLFAKPANLLVSLIDDGDDSCIRLYLGKSTDINDVMGLDQTLRQTATKYNMLYNVKRMGKELSPSDFATAESVTENKEETPMNLLLEGMYGTTRSSYLKLENARMIVRHSKKIDETVIGSRGRHIDAIFIENAVGERFLFPTRQLAPARAMTQHVNHGGSFADAVGAQIIRMANDYANLGQASGFIAQNAAGLCESAQGIRESCRNMMYEMRKTFERLYRAKDQTKWEGLAEALQNFVPNALNEGEEASVDMESLRESLTIEGRELEESVLLSVAEAIRNCPVTEDEEDGDGKDAKCPTCGGKGLTPDMNKTCPSCGGSGVESVSVAGRMVPKAAWDQFKSGKLELFNPPSDEMTDADGKGAGKPRFVNADAQLSYLLGQIVPEVKNDGMMNFLAYVAEELHKANSADRQKALRTVAMHAIKLAGLQYIPAPAAQRNEAVREFEEWVGGFDPAAVLSEHEDDDYDFGWEPTEDDIEPTAEEVIDQFDVRDFLDTYGEDFNWKLGDTPEEKEFDKSFIIGLLAHYLDKKLHDQLDMVGDLYDFKDAAADLFSQFVEPVLKDAGYTLSEGELCRSDILINTDQGEDLKREVTKSTSTDPTTGEEVPADMDYVSRMRTLAGMPWNR